MRSIACISLFLAFAAAGVLSGCVQVNTPKTLDVNINDNTGGGSSGGGSLPALPENSGEGSMLSQASRAAKKMADTDFYADDILTLPGKKVELTAHCDIEDAEKDLYSVTFSLDGKLLGRVNCASEESTAVAPWMPPRVGIYNIAVSTAYTEKKTGLPKTLSVNLIVCVVNADAPMIIVDLDHTVVGSGFFKVVMRMAAPMPGSAAVMRKLSQDYTVVYLTHRPAMLTNLSKKWLITNNFPVGPLLTNQDNKFSSGEYKSNRLKELRCSFKNIQVGIGDKDSDVAAYRANNMSAFWIIKYKDKRKSLEKIIKTIAPFRRDHKVQVVFAWEQIEQALDGQKAFPVGLVEKQLRDRVAELRRMEKDKKHKDDDDEDEDDD